ncbi:MAG: orotidine 5'-phosphate decarboxylase / HUMPS family protein [Pseudomonadota bacterium]
MKDFAIIASLDLDEADAVLDVASRIAPCVDSIKIGVPTLLERGVEFLRSISDLLDAKPVLVDLKIADIGFRSSTSWNGTNAKIMLKLKETGATHVTVHGFPGPSSVAEAVEIGNRLGLGILLLPMMSHVGAEAFFSANIQYSVFDESCRRSGVHLGLSTDSTTIDVTDGVLRMGEAAGVSGYIGPATRPEVLKRYRTMTQKTIWCPGFGRQDRQGRSLALQFEDWARIVGPRSAAIVGSLIFGARDPVLAAEEIIHIRDMVVENLSPAR